MTRSTVEASGAVRALLRPLSARSVLASVLLGTHPPALPGRSLVALAVRFGIAPGTARVALSRMVDRGELTNDDGIYALAGDLLERQQRQDHSRTEAASWDGTWEMAIVTATGRPAPDRTRLRTSLVALGLGERREGVWMRPANLAPDRLPLTRRQVGESVEWFSGVMPRADGGALAAAIFDLDGWASIADELVQVLGSYRARLDSDEDALVAGFVVASAALRHLVHDPQLPVDLQPAGWPAARLRAEYASYEADYQRLTRAFFRSERVT